MCQTIRFQAGYTSKAQTKLPRKEEHDKVGQTNTVLYQIYTRVYRIYICVQIEHYDQYDNKTIECRHCATQRDVHEYVVRT